MRDEYLKSQWTPYPPAPKDCQARGRFLGWASPEELLLWENESRRSVPFRDERMKEVLIPGDLISVSEDGAVQLIAPWTLTGVFRPVPSEALRLFAETKQIIFRFFAGRGFLEVATPSLVACPGTEPSLEVFRTELRHGSRSEERFLPTSPELHLKKALALGWERIFEMKTCFRNGEITPLHQPEFLMLEWYRAWEPLESLEGDVLSLIQEVVEKTKTMEGRAPRAWRRTSMAELFDEKLGIKLSPEMTRDDYAGFARDAGLRVLPTDSLDDLFFQLFTEKIESEFDPETLMIVGGWPPSQAALARVGEDGWAERFEVYWRGLELANAFHELNDPEAQKARFREDLRKKKELGRTQVPLDREFLEALESGMPPSSGIALGVERLVMAIFGIPRIEELRAFPEKERPLRT